MRDNFASCVYEAREKNFHQEVYHEKVPVVVLSENLSGCPASVSKCSSDVVPRISQPQSLTEGRRELPQLDR